MITDHLPAELEPAGALQQDACERRSYRLVPGFYRSSCGHAYPVIWTDPDWQFCPWCGKPIKTVEAAE